MQGNYSVAIDGPSGAGKSTIARAAAKRFGFLYVDTGAIYRTVGLAVERCGFEAGDEASVKALLPKLDITLGRDGGGVQTSPGLSGRPKSPGARPKSPPCPR